MIQEQLRDAISEGVPLEISFEDDPDTAFYAAEIFVVNDNGEEVIVWMEPGWQEASNFPVHKITGEAEQIGNQQWQAGNIVITETTPGLPTFADRVVWLRFRESLLGRQFDRDAAWSYASTFFSLPHSALAI